MSIKTRYRCALTVALLFAAPSFGRGDAVVFPYTGAVQAFTVPDNISSINVQLWGAGGASDPTNSLRGGAGGYTVADLFVTPGSVFSIMVGQGGFNSLTPVFGGGGAGAGTHAPSGGGLTGIFDGSILQSNSLAIAAGGGAAASGSGGAGGGFDGTSGTGWFAGLGGTQFGGGLGSAPGLALAGGSATSNVGGGGGGGYFGGGSGFTPYGGGGGGGSSYVTPLASSAVLYPGNFWMPSGTTEENYVNGIGLGGNDLTGGVGGNGLAVISYAAVAVPEPSAFLFLLVACLPVAVVRRWRQSRTE